MADRSIVVRLRAEVAGFRQAMNDATNATRRTREEGERATTSMGRMVQSADDNREAWDRAGATMTAFGALAMGGFLASIKAAISWESSWAGVLKTVDATPSKLAEIEDGLRGLARELPSSHAEIAAVAEAAGQLGVKAEDVVGFTRTMIDLGETTNLTADEAATAIAQISNVMGTMARDGSVGVQRFGATLVALGNDGASTEAEILSMAQRIAGAGRLIGASEADVLALSNAMASMGIRAELGGGVMSRVMTRMYTDVKGGGEGLATLAQVAGVSASEFAAAFEADPVRAIDAMVQGLGRIKNSGGNVVETMKDLGIKGTEETSVILSLTGAGDLLTKSLDLGAKAWQSNTALAEEAAKRYDTVEAKISIAKNSITDAAIGMGNAFLPVVADMAEGVSNFASMLATLDPATQAAIGGVAGLVGVTALSAGAFLLLFPRVMETVRAFRTLATVAPRVASALMMVGKATLPLLAVAAAIIAIDEATKTTIKAPEVADVTSAMLDVADSAGVAKGKLDAFFAIDSKGGFNPIDGIDGLSEAFDRLSGKGRSFTQWAGDNLNFLPGFDNADVRQVNASFEAIDTALANLQATGASAQAALNWDLLIEESARAGISVDRLKEKFPQYVTALQDTENAQRLAGESGEAMTEQQKLAAAVAQEATEAQIKWREALVGSAAEFVSFGGAYDDLVQARTDGAQALADEANKVEGVSKTWQDFYDGQTISIDDYVAKLQEQLDAQAAWQTNMTTIASQVSQATFDELAKLGPEYAGLIDQLAKEPERLKDIDGMFNTGAENANAFADGIESIYMPELSIGANTDAAMTAVGIMQASIDKAAASQPPWLLDADGKPALTMASYLQAEINGKGTALPDWAIGANAAPAILVATGTVNQINGMGATLKVGADTASAEATASNWIDRMKSKFISVPIVAAPAGGVAAVQAKATGGSVVGPGTGTSDSIPALLSNGEHVLTADDVAKAGGQAEIYRLRQAIQAGRLPAFAEGGAVRRRRFASGGEASARSWSNINPAPMRSSSQVITVAAPSLEGLSISGTLAMRGDGLVDLIDGRIVAASNVTAGAMRGGKR